MTSKRCCGRSQPAPAIRSPSSSGGFVGGGLRYRAFSRDSNWSAGSDGAGAHDQRGFHSVPSRPLAVHESGQEALVRVSAGATVVFVQVRHICEVCDTEEVLTPEAAYEAGWDYPPRMGLFGVISPRTCPCCSVNQTAWWAIVVDGFTPDMLSSRQSAAVARIRGEPNNVVMPETGDELP